MFIGLVNYNIGNKVLAMDNVIVLTMTIFIERSLMVQEIIQVAILMLWKELIVLDRF